MTGIEWGALMFVFLLVLLALRVHIGMAMMLAGSLGYGIVGGWEPLLNYFKSGAYARLLQL